jgi:hypothetical protein
LFQDWIKGAVAVIVVYIIYQVMFPRTDVLDSVITLLAWLGHRILVTDTHSCQQRRRASSTLPASSAAF